MNYQEMTVQQLADIISREWKNVHFAAAPYLNAMRTLRTVDDEYGWDHGSDIVRYFLGNAKKWTGPVAKEIKAELKRRITKAP